MVRTNIVTCRFFSSWVLCYITNRASCLLSTVVVGHTHGSELELVLTIKLKSSRTFNIEPFFASVCVCVMFDSDRVKTEMARPGMGRGAYVTSCFSSLRLIPRQAV